MSIPHNKPCFDQEENAAAARVLNSAWVAQGAEVEAFENEICEYLGLPHEHAVAVSSGTAALYLALWVLGAKSKQVALPIYACSSLRNAVQMAQAEEILVDNASQSPNIDLAAVQQLKSELAIVPHIFGIPADIAELKGMRVIEDCAQALGAKLNNKRVGCLSDVSIFSFYATKLITSGGQGGMLVSENKTLVDAVRDYRQFDCRQDHKFRFNFQMTDLQAAIGRAQLKKLPDFIAYRQELFEIYQSYGIDFLDCMDSSSDQPVRYRAVMKSDQAKAVINKLAANGIKAIVPIEDWELASSAPQEFKHAYALTHQTVSLPLYPTLTKQQVRMIAEVVVS